MIDKKIITEKIICEINNITSSMYKITDDFEHTKLLSMLSSLELVQLIVVIEDIYDIYINENFSADTSLGDLVELIMHKKSTSEEAKKNIQKVAKELFE